jgi:hypothetical protein
MGKTLVAAIAAAVLGISGTAAAIDTLAGPRTIWVVGLGKLTLGSAELLALGRVGDDCRYLMTWESPYNPNEVLLCDLRERRTVLFPSCVANRSMDVPSIVRAGPDSGVRTRCSGFDPLGVAIDTGDVSLILASRGRGLEGIVIFPWGVALPVEIS